MQAMGSVAGMLRKVPKALRERINSVATVVVEVWVDATNARHLAATVGPVATRAQAVGAVARATAVRVAT